jgi:hypothetical protein
MKIGLLAGLCLMLSGCLFRSPSDLYEQPAKSAGYEQLNRTIADIKSGLEAEYGTSVENAVIVTGNHTATIQLQDLDGDGERESAVTFLKVPGVEKSLKIYIFRQEGEEYEVAGIVEGDGVSIYSVDYVELNRQGKKELVVNWQISAGVYQLGAYTLDEIRPASVEEQNALPVLTQEARQGLQATQLLLTGCSASSGEKQIFPICMSMDRLEDGRLQLAVQVSSMDSGEAVFAAAGDSFEQTLEILGASMPYPLHFGQLRLCILGDTLARESDLTELLMPLYRLYTINPDATVMVSLGNAAKTMAAQKPDLGVRLSTYLDQLLTRLEQEKLTPGLTLWDVLHQLGDGQGDPLLGLCALNSRMAAQSGGEQQAPSALPALSGMKQTGSIAIGEPSPGAELPPALTAGDLPRDGGNPVEYVGCAAVGGGQVTGILTAAETRLLLTLRQQATVTCTGADQAEIAVPVHLYTEETVQLVTKIQQLSCDALGVRAAAVKLSNKTQPIEIYMPSKRFATMHLTITPKCDMMLMERNLYENGIFPPNCAKRIAKHIDICYNKLTVYIYRTTAEPR